MTATPEDSSKMIGFRRNKIIWYAVVGLYVATSAVAALGNLHFLDWFGSCASIVDGADKEQCRLHALPWIGPAALLIFSVEMVRSCAVGIRGCGAAMLFSVAAYAAFTFFFLYTVQKVVVLKSSYKAKSFRIILAAVVWLFAGFICGIFLT